MWDRISSDCSVAPQRLYEELAHAFPEDGGFYGREGPDVKSKVIKHINYLKARIRKQEQFYSMKNLNQSVMFANSKSFYAYFEKQSFNLNQNFETFSDFSYELGTPDPQHVFTIPVTPDHVSECKIPNRDKENMMQSLCFFGPANLYNLHAFMNHVDNKDKRMLCCDGTFAILDNNKGTLLSLGAVVLDINPGETKIKRKFWPLLHFLTQGETLSGSAVLACMFQLVAIFIYGRPPDFSHFVSDYSKPIRNGFSRIFPETNQYLCFPHIIRSVDKKPSFKSRIGTNKKMMSQVR